MPKISVIINKWCGNVLKYLTLKLLLGVCTHIHKCTQTVITTDGLIIVCQLKRWQDTCLRVTGDSFILSIFLPHLKLCVNLWWRSTGASYYVSNLIINSRCLVLTCQWARSGSGHREKKKGNDCYEQPWCYRVTPCLVLRSVTLLERSVTEGRGSNTGDSRRQCPLSPTPISHHYSIV